MIRYVSAWSVFFALSLLSGPASADRLLALHGDAGLGAIGPTAQAALELGFDVREGGLALGLAGRVRLALGEADGQAGPLRRRDFDEVSDYLHILRYFDYARQIGGVSLHVAAGEIRGGTLGHGTLLRDFSNIADPDHLHAGARITLHHDVFDLSLLLDNLARPTLLGGRFALRPIAKLRALSFGVSGVMDIRAPTRGRFANDGRPAVDAATWTPDVDTRVLGFASADVALWLHRGRKEVTPYVDVATSFQGIGLHAGATGKLPLGESGLTLGLQVEYRLTSGGYAPDYFGTFYDIERYQASLAFSERHRLISGAQTKLHALDAGLFGGHGVLAQVSLDAGRKVQAKVGYRYHPGPDGSQLWVRVVTEPTTRLTLGALAVVRALGQASQGADGLATLAEARYRITPYLYALAQFARSWALSEETHTYAPLLRFNVGVGGTFSR